MYSLLLLVRSRYLENGQARGVVRKNQQVLALEWVYFSPITSRVNVPGFEVGRALGLSGCGDSNSEVTTYTSCATGFTANVRAPRWVFTLCSTRYFFPSLPITVSVPSPLELKASFLPGSNPTPSTCSPIGSCARFCPFSASVTNRSLLWQPEKRTWCAVSISSPDGSSHPFITQRFTTVSFAASTSAISLVLSMFTKTCPLPSATANSGFPPKATVPATFSDFASIAVASLLSALKAKTRWVTGS